MGTTYSRDRGPGHVGEALQPQPRTSRPRVAADIDSSGPHSESQVRIRAPGIRNDNPSTMPTGNLAGPAPGAGTAGPLARDSERRRELSVGMRMRMRVRKFLSNMTNGHVRTSNGKSVAPKPRPPPPNNGNPTPPGPPTSRGRARARTSGLRATFTPQIPQRSSSLGKCPGSSHHHDHDAPSQPLNTAPESPAVVQVQPAVRLENLPMSEQIPIRRARARVTAGTYTCCPGVARGGCRAGRCVCAGVGPREAGNPATSTSTSTSTGTGTGTTTEGRADPCAPQRTGQRRHPPLASPETSSSPTEKGDKDKGKHKHKHTHTHTHTHTHKGKGKKRRTDREAASASASCAKENDKGKGKGKARDKQPSTSCHTSPVESSDQTIISSTVTPSSLYKTPSPRRRQKASGRSALCPPEIFCALVWLDGPVAYSGDSESESDSEAGDGGIGWKVQIDVVG